MIGKEKNTKPKYNLVMSGKNIPEGGKMHISRNRNSSNVQATEILFWQYLLIYSGAHYTCHRGSHIPMLSAH